jgi:hypothetical protein
MSQLKRGCVVEFFDLARNRLNNLGSAMTRIATPETSCSINDFPAIFSGVIHTITTLNHFWLRRKFSICGKRHPKCAGFCFHIVNPASKLCEPSSDASPADDGGEKNETVTGERIKSIAASE